MSPDSRSVVLHFPNPPISLVVSSVCVALYRCVSCGIFRGTWLLGVVTRAKRRGSVARVCRLTPLCSRTTLCLLSLLHHRERWVSLTYHAILVRGPLFGVSLRLQMQEVSTRGTRRFSLLLLLLRLKSNRTWSSHRRVHPMEESPAPLVVILRTNLSRFTVSTLVCHHRPLRGT